jgi:hypothetical protein
VFSGIQKDVHLGAQNEILLSIVLRDRISGSSATKGVVRIERSPNVVGERIAEMLCLAKISSEPKII